MARRCRWCQNPIHFSIGLRCDQPPPEKPEIIFTESCGEHIDNACEEGLRLLISLRAALRGDEATGDRLARGRIVSLGIKEGGPL